jgi:hypothetical protein
MYPVGPTILIYYDAQSTKQIKYYKLSSTLQLRITHLKGKNFVLFDREREKQHAVTVCI